MKNERLLDALEKIDEELIEEAAPGNKPPKKKANITCQRRRLSYRKGWFVAVLAASLFLVGAGSVVTIYNLVVGFGVEQTEDYFSVNFSEGVAPAVIENGRLWFVAAGEHIDITDIIDENTPYIYSTVNTRTNQPSYIVIGGTRDDFGYAEIWVNQGEIGFAARRGELSMMMKLTIQQFQQGLWKEPAESMEGTWLINAIKQLELELLDS